MNSKQVISELKKVQQNLLLTARADNAITEAIKDVETLSRIREVLYDPDHLEDILHTIVGIVEERYE